MAMEVEKVNELEENNKVSKLVGVTHDGDVVRIAPGNIMAKAMYQQELGDEPNITFYKFIGYISSIKGNVLCVNLGAIFLLGETQHYTTDESDAIKNKKILLTDNTGSGYFEIINYTGEEFSIYASAIGFFEDSFL